MKHVLTVAGLLLVSPAASQSAEPHVAWAPKQAPLMTKWAAQVDPRQPLPEYPRPQMVRSRWLNLNGLWEFSPATTNDAVPVGKPLPERILVPFPVESALSGVMRSVDRMWYRRFFTVPADWEGDRVLLHFGAVDWKATVYVNGQAVGGHEGGYGAFTIDIAGQLKPGENELIVGVFDPSDRGRQPVGKQTLQPRGYWYTACSGIWQTVWLEPVPVAHVVRLDLTPDVPRGLLRLVAQGQDADVPTTVQAVASVGGVEVGRATGALGKEIELPIPKAHLWSPEDPFLYDLTVSLKTGAAVVDQVTSYFGMRSIALGKVAGVTRPLLNGAFVFQMGTLDQGYWPDGNYTAPTDEALRFDIEQTKKCGYNTIRKHIKVEPARWYYWADRLGVLVWQDMPAMAADGIRPDGSIRQGHYDASPEERKRFASEFIEMVNQLRSAPSIIGWIEFNENWGEYREKNAVLQLADTIKRMDPGRLLVTETGAGDAGGGDAIDWHTYPGPGSPPPLETRIAGLGEFGGIGFVVKDHSWTPVNRDQDTAAKYTAQYVDMIGRVKALMHSPGLSYAFFTQITDVENERNGLFTYDRTVFKGEMTAIRAAHDDLIATSRELGQTYTDSVSGDFSKAEVWSSSTGTWRVVPSGYLNVTPGISLANSHFNNLSVEADVTVPTTGEAGLLFRFSDGGGKPCGYFAGLSATCGLTLSHADQGVWRPIMCVSLATAPDEKRHLRVDAFGGTIRLFADDMTRPALEATDYRSMAGALGVRATAANARFSGLIASNPFVRLKPINVNGFVIHNSRDKDITDVDKNVNRDDDALWRLVPSLSDGQGLALESARLPSYYLRDHNGVITFEKDDGSSEFKREATWRRKLGLGGTGTCSYESPSHAGEYLRVQRPMVRKPAKSERERIEATFIEMK